MLDLVPFLIGIHIFDPEIRAQIHNLCSGENLLIYQRSAKALGRGCKDHVRLSGKLVHIVIHTFGVYDLKHILIDFRVLLIYVASGAIPADFHIPVSCKDAHQLSSRISGSSDNSCFNHNFSLPLSKISVPF